MNKKFLILLTLTYIILMPQSFAFSDTNGHWAEDTINNASHEGIIKGVSQDLFKPDDNMTRAELATVINRMLGAEKKSDKYIPDISNKDWYHDEIRKSVAIGIIKGDLEGNTNPNDFVSREQAITMIARAFEFESQDISFNLQYFDANDISPWALTYVNTFNKKGFITGYADGTLMPKANVSRAEAITMLTRVVAKNILQSSSNIKINGTMVVSKAGVTLSSTEIYGNLIIGEKAALNGIVFNNVMVEGDLILYAPIEIDETKISVKGNIIKKYESFVTSNMHYENSDYGFSFAIPDGAKVFDLTKGEKVNYNDKDIIVVNIQKDDKFYYLEARDIAKEELKKKNYDSIFHMVENGDIGLNQYVFYEDASKSHFLLVKRDNIIYTLLFINIISDNIFDNTIANIKFSDGAYIQNHDEAIYNNKNLCLKFVYRNGYVSVDDSYNTGIVNTNDAIFKMFIQVTRITDIGNYSTNEIKLLLKTLSENDGKIVSEKIGSLYGHDTIRFKIQSGEDSIISLYVIVGNNLYNFMFKGEKDKIESIGEDIFDRIAMSMEF